MNRLFTSGGESIAASASASALLMNIQDGFPLGLTGLMSLQPQGLSRVFDSKASILWCSAFFMVQLSHPYMTTGKTIALTRQTFVGKVMSLLFNMLSRLVFAFLPRRKSFFFFPTFGTLSSTGWKYTNEFQNEIHAPKREI